MLIIIRNFFVICLLLCTLIFNCFAINEPTVSASSCVLIDADTLEVLYQKNAHQKRSMASTTKIMTTLLAVESDRLDKTVTVKEKLYIEGTAIGFNKGDKITLETLCYAMLLESGNDAAVLTSVFLAGSERDFSYLMNQKAREIGMKNTNFVTASGLDDENHYTTAYDMALLGAFAIQNVKFKEICSTYDYKAEFIEPDITRYFLNHNRLIKSCEGVFGIKTGFTKKSGRCLVSACNRYGKNLVAVTLNAPDDWNDHKKLYDYGYSLYEMKDLNVDLPESIKIYGANKELLYIDSYIEDTAFVRKSNVQDVVIQLQTIVYAPVERYDIIGKISVYSNDIIIKEYPIFSSENVPIKENTTEYKPSLFQRFTDFINDVF